MISRDEAIQILKEEGCDDKVIEHCVTVADEAVRIARENAAAGMDVDIELVEIGALLHDLGRAQSHDIDHAVLGMELAKKHNLDERVISIIKKHVGAGLTCEEAHMFGLPDDDYMPRTLEEKIVAHADNIVKGTKVITLKKRIKIMKERGLDKESRQRVKELAYEVDFNYSDD
ncbi:Ribonuclease Y [Methanosarcinaceae archaeon Ag5]|uniref:Ribonuclease Y n=1 Tax=Methanolapillus africanus TaxID=3028297 RepID=A0AAE4MIG1_9EURY|nr:Ribonuclease Y [Methanosarcinaceae archaeon Ag5]